MWCGEDTWKRYAETMTLHCELHAKMAENMIPKDLYRSLLEKKMHLFWIIKVHIMDPLLFNNSSEEPVSVWLKEVVKLNSQEVLDVLENRSLKPEVKETILLFDSVSTYVLSEVSKFCCICNEIYYDDDMFRYFEDEHESSKIGPVLFGFSLTKAIEFFDSCDVYKKVCEAFKSFDQKIVSAAFVISYYHFYEVCDDWQMAFQFFDKEMASVLMEMDSDMEICTGTDVPETNVRLFAKYVYKRGDYGKAINLYSSALKLSSYNFFFYGNRAQAFLKVELYDEAEIDCRAAITLNPHWAKGYYRLASALENQKRLKDARAVLYFAIGVCEKEKNMLIEYYNKLIEQINQGKLDATAKSLEPKQESLEDGNDSCDDVPELESSDSENYSDLPELTDSSSSETEDVAKQQVPDTKPIRASNSMTKKEENPASAKESKKNDEQKSAKPVLKTSDTDQSFGMADKGDGSEPPKSKKKLSVPELVEQPNDLIKLEEFLRSMREGREAYERKSMINAAKHFHQALSETKDCLKRYNIGEISVICLKYAYATACSRCGSLEDLHKAIATYKDIVDSYPQIGFPGAYYGLGFCYYKMNDFKTAISYLRQALIKIKDDERCGIYTWPGTERIIDELKSDKLKISTEELIKTCECPPPADAICRFESCSGQPVIYYSDLDFKGFVSIHCMENCKLQYHIACWKELKDIYKRTDKEFLDTPCLTPDCAGCIVKVELVNKEGNIDKDFESEIVKQKKNVKHKKTKLEKKLETKERKRKRHRSRSISESQEVPEDNHSIPETVESVPEPDLKCSNTPHKEKLDGTECLQAVCSSRKTSVPDALQLTQKEAPVYVIRKDVEQKDSDSKNPRHKEKEKKKPKKATFTLDQFCDNYQGENITHYNEYQLRLHRLRESARVAEEAETYWPSFCKKESIPQLDPDKPFYVPEHLRNDPNTLETILQSYGSASSKVEDIAAKKEEIYTQIEELLLEKRALALDDIYLTSKLDSLSSESKQIIEECGGFKSFVMQSMHFAIVGETLCLFSEMCDIYNSRSINELDGFELGDGNDDDDANFELSGLNPNAAEYSPPEHVGDDAGDPNGYLKPTNESAPLLSTIFKLRRPLSSYQVRSKDHGDCISSSAESVSTDMADMNHKSLDDEKISESLLMLFSTDLPQDVKDCLHEAVNRVQKNEKRARKLLDGIKPSCSLERVDKTFQIGCPQSSMVSKGVMKKDDELKGALELVDQLSKGNAEAAEKYQQLVEKYEKSLDDNSKLHNKLSVDLPGLSQKLEEAEAAKEKENKLLKSKINQLEKEIKQWRQKHDQVIDNQKESEKDKARLQTKLNGLASKVKALEEEKLHKEEELSSQSAIIETMEKIVREKEKLVEEASNRARNAEVSLLNVKKTEFLERLDLSIKNAKQKLSEFEDGMAQAKDALQPYLSACLEALIRKLKEHLSNLHEMRDSAVKNLEDHIVLLEMGKHLSELRPLNLPSIPDPPTFEELMSKPAQMPPSATVVGPSCSNQNISMQQLLKTQVPQNLVPNMNLVAPQHHPYGPMASASTGTILPPVSQTNQIYGTMFSQGMHQTLQNQPVAAPASHPYMNPSVPLRPPMMQQQPKNPPGLSTNGLGNAENPLAFALLQNVPSSSAITKEGSSESLLTKNRFGAKHAANGATSPVTASPLLAGSTVSLPRSVSHSSMADEDRQSELSFTSLPVAGPGKKAALEQGNHINASGALHVSSYNSNSRNFKSSSSSREAVVLDTLRKTSKLGDNRPQSPDRRSEHSATSSQPARKPDAPSVTSEKKKRSYAKLLEKLKEKYPDMPEDELMKYMKEYRQQKTKFSGMPMDSIVSGISELINKSVKPKFVYKPKQQMPKVLSNKPLSASPKPVREVETEVRSAPWGKAQNTEPVRWEADDNDDNTCVICLDVMTPETMLKVDCGHTYHHKCIKDWLQRNSTCTICRNHILLPEEYPALG